MKDLTREHPRHTPVALSSSHAWLSVMFQQFYSVCGQQHLQDGSQEKMRLAAVGASYPIYQ